jgi:hypothetical protein
MWFGVVVDMNDVLFAVHRLRVNEIFRISNQLLVIV